ncbi:sugar transferase [Sphingomonas sp. Root50]|nr:sugar transferase [Sphingomonas sp. Root1294]KQY72645.1 sugar transferase [Sphingomonas sp. Root50]KRB87731.1 sugar transferase [Sphingomonas sp. Root720]
MLRSTMHLRLKPGNDMASAPLRPDEIIDEPSPASVSVPPVRRKGLSFHIARDTRRACEFAALAAALMLSASLFPKWIIHEPVSVFWGTMIWLVTYAGLCAIGPDSAFDCRTDRLAQKIGYWLKATGAIIVLAFMSKDHLELSRLWIATGVTLGCVVIYGVMVVSDQLSASLHRNGTLGDRLAIYGTDGRIEHLLNILNNNDRRFQIDSIYGETRDVDVAAPERIKLRWGLDDLIARARAGHIDAILLNLPWHEQGVVEHVVRRLEEVNVDVMIVPSELQLARRTMSIQRCGPFATIALYQRPMQGIGALMKIALDRSVAALALLFFGPLMLFVAAAIWIESPGPVLFRQKRRGMNNEPFTMLKFRSMHLAASDQNADKLVTRGDSRVTRVGAFIRKTSLDELPQLINILRGDMSLVGPRPHAYGAKAADRLYEEVVARYPARHRVLPGLTGLAQVRGFRGNTLREEDIIRRFDSDLEYIERWSISLDLVIIVRTAITLFFHKEAY